MKKQASSRAYNFPDSELYVQCIERIKYAERDVEQFTTYGYPKSRIDEFKEKCGQFEELPTDDELLGIQMQMTENKQGDAERLKTAIRSVMTRVAMKYNNRTGRYRRFGTQKMGDMSDAQLLFCAKRVIRVGKQMIPFLADVGLSEIHLDKVKDTMNDFENSIHIQKDRVNDRDIYVEKRTALGNDLYQEMIVLCNIGKDIWVETDPVRYEQYVIYESNAEQKRARKAKGKE